VYLRPAKELDADARWLRSQRQKRIEKISVNLRISASRASVGRRYTLAALAEAKKESRRSAFLCVHLRPAKELDADERWLRSQMI